MKKPHDKALTPEQLAALPDEQIDYSDTPNSGPTSGRMPSWSSPTARSM